MDIPVPGRGWRFAGVQGFVPGQSSTAPDFRPGQSSSSSLHFPVGFPEALDEPGQVFFFFSHFSPK